MSHEVELPMNCKLVDDPSKLNGIDYPKENVDILQYFLHSPAFLKHSRLSFQCGRLRMRRECLRSPIRAVY